MPLDAKNFDLECLPGLEVWESKPLNRGASQIEAFTIQGHDLRMLKASHAIFFRGLKTSNSKLLTYWDLVAKNFDLR